MTLIIARKFGDRIIVVSDTMISGKGLSRPSPIPGQLKTIVIDDRVSISFAGTADTAIATIREAQILLVKKRDLSKLVSFLKEHSAGDENDFIIASHIGIPTMYKIWNGNVASGEKLYWIGDSEAANIAINRISEIERDTLVNENEIDPTFGSVDETRFSSAIGRLYMKIGIQLTKSVGGLFITQLGSSYGYTYIGSASTIIRDTCQIPPGWTAEQLMNQESGMTKYSYKGTSIYSDFEYRAVSAGAARSAFLMGSAA